MTHWLTYRGNELLVHLDGERVALPQGDEPPLGATDPLPVQVTDADSYVAASLPAEAQAPDGMAFQGLRALHGRLAPDLWRVAGRAFQLVEWDRSHRFCSRCGTPTELDLGEGVRKCLPCGQMHYPRINPAVIVLVRRGDEALLGRSHNFPPGRYSTLAGFVEAGETLEEAVAREVFEESGIAVTNIRYFGSQPWPFPHSLMIGFTAEYAGGDIRVQEKELADVQWFRADQLPSLPPPYSIARQLIDWFVSQPGKVG